MKCLLLLITLLSPYCWSHQYLIEFQVLMSTEALNDFADRYQVKLKKLTPTQPGGLPILDRVYIAHSTDSTHQQTMIEQDPAVKSIELNEELKVESYSTHWQLNRYQWYLQNNGELFYRNEKSKVGFDLGLQKLKNVIQSETIKDVVIAVLDSGVDYNHPDLRPYLAWKKEECDENGQIPFMPTEDNDGNGYVGDCLGWNFAASDERTNEVRMPLDREGHGTHVSGLIAARGVQSGFQSIGVNTKILPIKVFDSSTAITPEVSRRNEQRQYRMSRSDLFLRAIDYAIRSKVDVINMSFGWSNLIHSQLLFNALMHATQEHNIIVVAAAGNDQKNATVYPCTYPHIICVGASNANGEMADFSNFGMNVDLFAPGESIVSTWPLSQLSLRMGFHGYDLYSGTSQSAPLVSAMAGVLKGINPDANLIEVKRMLFNLAPYSKSFQGLRSVPSFHNWEQIDRDFILPHFKGLRTAIYQNQQGRLFIPFTAYSQGRVKAKIKIEITGDAIENSQQEMDLELNAQEATRLPIDFRVNDENAHHELQLKVTLLQNETEQIYYHQLKLARNLFQDAEVIRKPVRLNNRHPLTFRRQQQTLSPLRNVVNPHQPLDNSLFYLPFNHEGTHRIFFFEEQEQALSELAYISIHPAENIKAVFKIENQLIVNTTAVYNNHPVENFHYFDSNFKSLFDQPLQVQLQATRLNSRTRNFELATYSQIPQVHWQQQSHQGKDIFTPVFASANSLVPHHQVEQGDFIPTASLRWDQIYYFDLASNRYSTLMTNKNRQKVLNQVNASTQDQLQFIRMISFNDKIRTYWNLRRGIQNSTLLVDFDNDEMIKVKILTSPSISSQVFELQSLEKNLLPIGIALAENYFTQRSTLQLSQDESQQFTLNWQNQSGFMMIHHLQANSDFYTLAKSNDSLLLYQNAQLQSKMNFSSFDFLNSPSLVQQMFYPLPYQGDLSWGYYLNQQQLTEDIIQLITIEEKQMKSPARFSLIPTNGCAVLNPHYDYQQQVSYYRQLCAIGQNQWQLQKVPYRTY